jgi:hypothetical protein
MDKLVTKPQMSNDNNQETFRELHNGFASFHAKQNDVTHPKKYDDYFICLKTE